MRSIHAGHGSLIKYMHAGLENHEHLQTTTRIPVQRLQHFCKPLVSSSMNCTQLASRRAHGSPPRCSLGSTGKHARYVTRAAQQPRLHSGAADRVRAVRHATSRVPNAAPATSENTN